MNRRIQTTVDEEGFHIDCNYYHRLEVFGGYGDTVYIYTDDPFAHHLAESLYDEEAMQEFQYIVLRQKVMMKIRMKPNHNFFELDFTMFNWNFYGEELKQFIWE